MTSYIVCQFGSLKAAKSMNAIFRPAGKKICDHFGLEKQIKYTPHASNHRNLLLSLFVIAMVTVRFISNPIWTRIWTQNAFSPQKKTDGQYIFLIIAKNTHANFYSISFII